MEPKNGKSATESALPENQQQRFTIEDAFNFYYEADGIEWEELNLKRAVLAVAFLLDFLSDGGNEPVDSLVANGLAAALKKCARDTGYVRPNYREALALQKSDGRKMSLAAVRELSRCTSTRAEIK